MSDDKQNDNTEELESIPPDEFEDSEIEDSEEAVADKLKTLRKKLRECEDSKRQHLEDLQRSKADYLNARRRLEEERVRDKEKSASRFIEQLLPLCDSFHMAMGDQDLWGSVSKEWRQGVEAIKGQLDSILRNYQVVIIDPVGEPFDPTSHEAVSSVPVTDKAADHTVISVIQLGYARTVEGSTAIIRPARVTVGQYESK